jgi:uncharacterized membrane protein
VTESLEAREREPQRLEAFSDGVMAVIITIMAFDLKPPGGATYVALRHSVPSLLVYLLSFAFIGIYWNNHHHLLRATEKISARVMWANLHLLFWLSLIPVLTGWMASYYHDALPAAVYGVAAFGAGVAFTILLRAIIANDGKDSEVARAVGSFTKGTLSLVLYAAGVGLAWLSPWVSYALYASVSVMWFVPDPRLRRTASPGVEAG